MAIFVFMGQIVQHKEHLITALQANRQKIRGFGVSRLSLFGSFLTGKQRPDSDIDFLVEFEEGKKTFDNYMDLSAFLEELTGRKVELVTPKSLSKYIGPHIIRQAEHVAF